MVVWFSRGQLVVTDEWVRAGPRQYQVRALHDARLARAPLAYVNAVWAILTAVAVTGVVYWVAAAAWRQDTGVLLASFGVGILAGLAVLQATRRRELWIDTTDGSALIWTGYDRIEANKAMRAVRRAHERHRTNNGEWA